MLLFYPNPKYLSNFSHILYAIISSKSQIPLHFWRILLSLLLQNSLKLKEGHARVSCKFLIKVQVSNWFSIQGCGYSSMGLFNPWSLRNFSLFNQFQLCSFMGFDEFSSNCMNYDLYYIYWPIYKNWYQLYDFNGL